MVAIYFPYYLLNVYRINVITYFITEVIALDKINYI
jgi:hypothetical protein